MRTTFPSLARQLILPEAATQGRIVPRAIIVHAQAGTGSLFNYWLRGSSLECHFWVGVDGTIEQYMPINVRADANLKANGFAISIETENHAENVRAGAWDTDPFQSLQAAALHRLVNELCNETGIPKVQIPTWDGAGIGWHIMFDAPNWDLNLWAPNPKACPGRARIAHVRDVLIPQLSARPVAVEEGFPMALDSKEQDALLALVTATAQTVARLEAAVKRLTVIAGSDLGWDKAHAVQDGVDRDAAVAFDPTNK